MRQKSSIFKFKSSFSINILQLDLFCVVKKISMYGVSCYEHQHTMSFHLHCSVNTSTSLLSLTSQNTEGQKEWETCLSQSHTEQKLEGHTRWKVKPVPFLTHHTSSRVATIPSPRFPFTYTDPHSRIIQPWQHDVSLPKPKRGGHISYSSQFCSELTPRS